MFVNHVSVMLSRTSSRVRPSDFPIGAPAELEKAAFAGAPAPSGLSAEEKKAYDVVTEITKAGPFYKAENYHQMYYSKGGGSPYCHKYIKKF